jgi:type 1 glutamine amidotransferase
MRIYLYVLLSSLLTLMSNLSLDAKSKTSGSPVKVLIVDGFSNHDWVHTSSLIRGILEQTKRFQVDVVTCPANINDPAFATFRPQFDGYDVVVQNCNNIGKSGDWPLAMRQDFLNYIRKGGGVYIFHSANNSFADWDEYSRVIGLGWRGTTFPSVTIGSGGAIKRIPPGEGKSTSHGQRTDRVVHRIHNHPIHAGLPKTWMAAMIEVYTYPRGPSKNLDVLSWAEDPVTKTRWPIEWTVSYGRGRVYSSTLGHVWQNEDNPPGMSCAGFQTIMIRALQWLARRPTDFPVPADFPGEAQAVLYPLSGENTSARSAYFSSPFNGKDLTNWGYRNKKQEEIIFVPFDGRYSSEDGRFTGKDGVLSVNPWNQEKGPHFVSLWTKQEYPGDFSMTIEFRASVNADSGIFLRGKQLQCRDYLVAGPYKELRNYKAQDWNKIEVTVKNNVARCTCNGELLEEALVLPVTGPLGLEADRGLMEYRNIQIKKL